MVAGEPLRQPWWSCVQDSRSVGTEERHRSLCLVLLGLLSGRHALSLLCAGCFAKYPWEMGFYINNVLF